MKHIAAAHANATVHANHAAPTLALDGDSDHNDLKAPDMTRALVRQIYQSGMRRDEYLTWVHHAYRPPQPERGCRMFETPWLERVSRTPWWVVPATWLPVSLGCGAYYANSPGASALHGAALGACGAVLWSMLEYGLHRFAFHCDKHLPDHPLSLTGHFIFHGIHHKVPTDPLRLVMPPVATAAIAGAVWAGLQAGLWWLPTAHVAAIFGGTIASYVGYDLTHYALHHTKPQSEGWLGARQRYHRRHHAHSREVRGFGVTISFWDKIFGTSFT